MNKPTRTIVNTLCFQAVLLVLATVEALAFVVVPKWRPNWLECHIHHIPGIWELIVLIGDISFDIPNEDDEGLVWGQV